MFRWIHLLPPVGEGACSTAAAEERLPFLARMVDTYESLARKVFPLFLKGAIGGKLQNFALDSCLKITTQSIMISRIG